jgi:hypothetical protein
VGSKEGKKHLPEGCTLMPLRLTTGRAWGRKDTAARRAMSRNAGADGGGGGGLLETPERNLAPFEKNQEM